MRLLEKSLDQNVILSLDADGSGSVDKEEFVTGMLILLELAAEEDVVLWRKRFDDLDADGSGELVPSPKKNAPATNPLASLKNLPPTHENYF